MRDPDIITETDVDSDGLYQSEHEPGEELADREYWQARQWEGSEP